MGVFAVILAVGITGAVLAYVYGRALYRVGYWRGWEAHLELQARIEQLRADDSMRRAGLFAGLDVWPAREGGA